MRPETTGLDYCIILFVPFLCFVHSHILPSITNHQPRNQYLHPGYLFLLNISLSLIYFRRQRRPASAQLHTSLTNNASWLALLPLNQVTGSNLRAYLKVPLNRLTLLWTRITLLEPKVQGPNPFADPKVPFWHQILGSNTRVDLNVSVLRLTLPPVRLTSPQPKIQGPNPFTDHKVSFSPYGAPCCRSGRVTLGICPDWCTARQ